MHIGQKIKEVLSQKHKPVTWLAREINCERTNVYNIFGRKDISTGLLQKISIILGYDFFKDLSEETFKDEKLKK
ncbi:MAG: XRE family transcriptional regulator [Prevotella sp.]|nr:XRE family transcriptional regulator [Prevotella sp.]